MSTPLIHKVEIVNDKGLHARASAKLAEVVEGFDAHARITKGGLTAAGDSIMGLLMLAAAKGSFIEVETTGKEADALGRAIVELVTNRFGEGS